MLFLQYLLLSQHYKYLFYYIYIYMITTTFTSASISIHLTTTTTTHFINKTKKKATHCKILKRRNLRFLIFLPKLPILRQFFYQQYSMQTEQYYVLRLLHTKYRITYYIYKKIRIELLPSDNHQKKSQFPRLYFLFDNYNLFPKSKRIIHQVRM